MKTRAGKAWGAAAAVAAIAASLPLAINAYADPDTTPVAQVPDPQGPGCDAFKSAVPNWKDFAKQPVGTVLAGIPDISTFDGLISGKVNPGANVIPVFENGPYVVFAPTNAAFTEMAPGKFDALKASSVEELTQFGYYHAFLGLLGPDQVQGMRRTQDGAFIKVTGKGGDIKVNDTAKVVCGGISASSAQIYLIDAVLDPAQAPQAATQSGTDSTTSPATSPTSEVAQPTSG